MITKRPVLTAITALVLVLVTGSVQALTVFTDEITFITTTGASTLVNFDTEPGGSLIPDLALIDQQYLSLGVDFNDFAGGSPKAADRTGTLVTAVSDPNVMVTGAGIGFGAGGFEAVFTTPLTAFGIFVGGLQSAIVFGSTDFEALDSGGASLGIVNLNSTLGESAFGNLFFGVSSAVGIKTVRIDIGDADFVWFDNAYLGPALTPVPEPTTLLLLGLGLAGLGFARQRLH